ncbi:hypothetical protein FKM82_003481 [Ascaphus truei]
MMKEMNEMCKSFSYPGQMEKTLCPSWWQTGYLCHQFEKLDVHHKGILPSGNHRILPNVFIFTINCSKTHKCGECFV